ncbi:insulin-like growth factor-binding protein complex acid labile subunit [Anthonomus grandis grandis]|uniref:insulin-like growth factor-binding protein complex acid labile subunit n=1 Tax=Anthonomus grandis grandis TaxID=2921223 RepID=UPI0021657632|nr:insulin-like growth factor-binding protein complex acid labile subunit [Anthonomus grandis grandis]
MAWFYNVLMFVIAIYCASCNGWEKDSTCPLVCTCQLQHLTETSIYRFMQKDKTHSIYVEPGPFENNEVLYDETLDSIDLLDPNKNIAVRSATCILQTETDPLELIDSLSPNTESLTLIQAYQSGNKTIRFSWLSRFEKLISLELIGPTIFHKDAVTHLLCHIDYALENLNYLNLERVLVQNSKEQIQSFLDVIKENENVTFEYVQKTNSIHPLTIVKKNAPEAEEDIVPYNVFKEERKSKGEIPLFIGFRKLNLLRITNCELSTIHWEMFDGLNKLEYLILEKNNLTYIPAFAFYGTPNLKTLSLAHNKLLDIEITDLAGLLQLEYLDLTYNNFTQLSELSFPPFPKLKLANFANNPINIIFPNTFAVMNTTDSLIIGSQDIGLVLLPNSFIGLQMLRSLTVNNIQVPLLKRDLFVGMPQLKQMTLTGNIKQIEFDTFQEVHNLDTLILSNCHIQNISMDGFLGLRSLKYLDLSKNELEYIPSGIFDDLLNIKELYLNENKFKTLPRDIFSKIHPKMLRLNENPWHCTCQMSEWKPIIASRIKQKYVKGCDFSQDKGLGCLENRVDFKYVYDMKISPKCAEPEQYKNWSVFHAMRKILKCPDYKPKLKKHSSSIRNSTISPDIDKNTNSLEVSTLAAIIKPKYNKKIRAKLRKMKYLKYKLKTHSVPTSKFKTEEEDPGSSDANDVSNDLSSFMVQSEENNQLDNQIIGLPKMANYKKL